MPNSKAAVAATAAAGSKKRRGSDKSELTLLERLQLDKAENKSRRKSKDEDLVAAAISGTTSEIPGNTFEIKNFGAGSDREVNSDSNDRRDSSNRRKRKKRKHRKKRGSRNSSSGSSNSSKRSSSSNSAELFRDAGASSTGLANRCFSRLPGSPAAFSNQHFNPWFSS